MKRIAIWCTVLIVVVVGSCVVTTKAYQVHENVDDVQNDETIRGKRQQNRAVVIDSIFNIPIAAIKQTSTAAQTLSPQNAGTIDSVLKIPVTTLEAVSQLIKNRYQDATPSSSLSRPTSQKPQRRYDVIVTASGSENDNNNDIDIIKKQIEAQHERQRLYQRQLQKRRMELLERYNRRVQQQIRDKAEQEQQRFYRDPYGFNALTKWIVGPSGVVFNGHKGHGDGHVYQYYDEKKPLHFGIVPVQDVHQTTPTKPTTLAKTTSTTDSSVSSSNSRSSKLITPRQSYAVREVIDESLNPFTWPDWFGILNVLKVRTTAYPPATTYDERLPSKKQPKVKFNEQKTTQEQDKDEDYYNKNKYPKKVRKYEEAREEEITGNEIDGDVVNKISLATN